MQPHSFRTAPYSSSILSMADELNELGGFGTTSTARLSSSTSVAITLQPQGMKRRQVKGDSTITKQEKSGGSTYVTLSVLGGSENTVKVQETASNLADLVDATIPVSTDWLLDDFNGTLLSFGCDESNIRSQASALKLAHEALRAIYGKKDIGERQAMEYELYLSAWEVGSDGKEVICDLVDVLIGGGGGSRKAGDGMSFKAMHIPTLKHAASLLSNLPNLITSSPNQSHVFVRVISKSIKFNVTSAMHFVDIVSASKGKEVVGKKKKSKKGMREGTSLQRQHHSLSKVINGLVEASTGGSPSSVLLAASRESKLTQLLTPLLAGNNRTWFLGHLSKSAASSQECAETLKTLGIASNVMSGCIKNVNNGDNYGDRGGVEYIEAVNFGDDGEEKNGSGSGSGEGGDISDDSIDEGDKWLNEFKIRREAIVNSPIKKSPVKEKPKEEVAEKVVEKVKVVAGEGEGEGEGGDNRRRSYALTGGKKEGGGKGGKGLMKRQSTLIVGEGGVGGGGGGGEGALDREGWLWKKGQKRHNWKQRYFCIEGPLLVYYKEEAKNTKLGSVDLRGAKVDVVKHAKNDFAFDLTVPIDNGVVVRHLHADSEIDRIRWLLNLEAVLAEQLENVGLGWEGAGQWSEGEEEEEEAEEEEAEEVGGGASFSLTNALDSLMDDTDAEGDRATQMVSNTSNKAEDLGTLGDLGDLGGEEDEPSVPTLEHLASSEDFGVLSGNKKVNLFAADDKSDGSSMLSSVGGEGDSRVGELPMTTEYPSTSSGGGGVGSGMHSKSQSQSQSHSHSHSHSQYSQPSLSVPASSIASELLQSNYDTLLSMLREERRIRNKMNDKIANMEHTLLETSTAYQIEVDDLKMKNAEITRKFNKLGRESAYKEVFMQFEEEIKKTAGREADLQEKNVALEMEIFRMKRGGGGGGASGRGKAVGGGVLEQRPMQFQDGLMKQLTRRNKELEAELKKARAENSTLKQQGRLLHVSKTQNQHHQSSMLKLDSDLKIHKQKIHGLNLRKADLEAGLMQAEREAAMWRQAHATLEGDNARMQNELTKATADVMKYKHAAKNNNLIQRFLDKHAPKPAGGGRGGVGGGAGRGESLHAAVQSLASEVRRTCPALMSSVAAVANKIEDEVNLGRIRERDLMHSMVELLDENVENIEGGVQGFRERKIAVAQRVMLGK
ncbi:hypothetical protein TrST_g11877 [Triparma strigata]|uniref:PH domain-containing protein n=1 Tax=Triparma strigata TaxID=1606541 RepID=A0A9W7BGR3_9STRA|nr:hypothetical protein TrST_g11877 [Triparma strigata]